MPHKIVLPRKPRRVANRIKKDGTKGSPNWGGYRPGGGRPKNSERLDQTVKSFRSRYPTQPLDYAMCILNDLDPKTHQPVKKPYSKADKEWAVEKAMPYLNARLSAVQLTGADNGPVRYSVDVRKLSDEELADLEKIMSKASVPLEEEGNESELDQADGS